MKEKVAKKEIKGKESWRDLRVTKTCATCGKEYHPRNNSYQSISRFCSAQCSRKGRRKPLFPNKIKTTIISGGKTTILNDDK